MKLQIGIPDYDFRSLGRIAGAKILGRKAGRDLPLILVSAEDMAARHEKLPNVRGFPVYVAFDIKRQRIILHPAPDGEYELEVDRGEVKPDTSTQTLRLPKKDQS